MTQTITLGWRLDRTEREALLQRFPPRWPDADADHVTLGRMPAGTPLPPVPAHAAIVGHVDDGVGLEAMGIQLDGTVDRPDGSIFHITWSLDKAAGREPVESNDLLRQRRWAPIEPVSISLTPARLR